MKKAFFIILCVCICNSIFSQEENDDDYFFSILSGFHDSCCAHAELAQKGLSI